MSLIKIDNCHDCPFCNTDNETGSFCNINYDIDDYKMPSYKEDFVPNDCPLIKNEITISLNMLSVIGKENFLKLKLLKSNNG